MGRAEGPVYVIPEGRAYLRVREGHEREVVAFGPKAPDHPSAGRPCAACGEPLAPGCYTVLAPLGPGASEEGRERCREGRWFNAVCVEIHLACWCGFDTPEEAIAGGDRGEG